MEKRGLWTLAVLALVGLTVVIGPGGGVQAATVMLRVGTVEVAPGATVDVPIEAVGAPGIGPLHLELVYDPAVLTAQEVTRGPLLTNALMEAGVSARGRVVVAVVAATPIKGDGVVVTVRFKAIGTQGQQSALTLDAVKAWEPGNGRDVLVKTQVGQATVKADSTMLLVVALACLLVLVLMGAGGGLFLLLRQRPAGPRVATQPYVAPPRGAPPPAPPSSNLPGGKTGGRPRPTDLPK